MHAAQNNGNAYGRASKNNSLTGTVHIVTFHNSETGYCVLRVNIEGSKDPVTVLGKASSVTPGEHIDCIGEWSNHAKHGMQFKAKSLKTKAPTNVDGILKYLSSGMVKDIGPKMAQRLVDKWGEKTLDVLDNHPERLKDLPGIGPKRYSQLVGAWKEQSEIRDVMLFLQKYGLGTARAVAVYKEYGDGAIKKVEANPYRLATDIAGIGFKIADEIAVKLGIPHDSDIRANAGVQHILKEMTGAGHCAIPRDELIRESKLALGIPETTIQRAITDGLEGGQLKQDTIDGAAHIYPSKLFFAERQVARHLNRLKQGDLPWGEILLDKAVEWVQQRNEIQLAESQKAAITKTLSNKVSVITGGPGVGKTTISRSVLDVIEAKKVRVTLCAPTGRAAKRLAESTGRRASTIHRLLEFNPGGGFKHCEDDPLDTDFVLIDEASMVDVALMAALLKAVPDHAAVVIVGDRDQLPSVGEGSVLRDVIASEKIPTVHLTQIFRQAAGSKIITNAHLINSGKMPIKQQSGEQTDFYFFGIEENDDEPSVVADRVFHALVAAVSERIPQKFGFDPIKDIQVLTAMNNGQLGVKFLNNALQERLNSSHNQFRLKRNDLTFATGDKVIQRRNDYDKDVFNGDMGYVTRVIPKENTLMVNFEGRSVIYAGGDLDSLSLAYAKSIHRSQGSEYPVVVIPVTTQHTMMLERQLIYTGVTRGKQLVVVIGQERALEMAVKKAKSLKRKTNLSNLLQKSL